MFHVTINPRDPNEVLLSCDMTGAYISHDAGHHWRMFNLRGSIHFFAFDPIRPGVLYAATDVLWRSTDDGETWRLLWPRPSAVRAILMDSDHADETAVTSPNAVGKIMALAVDPADPHVLYAASLEGSHARLVVSRDGGTTWRVLLSLADTPLHIWIDPRSPRSHRDLYVATAGGMHVRIHGVWQWRAAPAGVTFTDVSAAFPRGRGISSAFYAVTGGPGSSAHLLVTKDGGATWVPSPLPGMGARLRAVATALHHPEVAYVSFKDMRIDGQNFQGVARTNDFGRHWDLVWRSTLHRESANVHDAWIADAMTPEWTEEPLSLTVDDDDPNLVYATDLGRTVATVDGGRTWTARYSEVAANSSQTDRAWVSTGLDVTTTYGYLFDPFDSKRRFILTTDIGLFRSEDSGRSWMRSVAGVPGRWRNTTYSLVFDPKVRGKMWAAMSEIHDLPRPKMWRHRSTTDYIGGICVSVDGGRTWQPSEGMPPTAPTSILVDPDSPVGRRVLWAATMGYGVYRSTDDGRTWSSANHGIEQENLLAWRLARASNGTLYVLIARRSEDGSIGNSGDGALYRSTDGGENWVPVPLPSGANGPNGIAIDPEDPERLYLALWARATPEVDSRKLSGTRAGAKPDANGTAIFNGVYGGVAISTDGGRNWRWTLERDRHIYDVTIEPHDRKVLYAAGFESNAWISRDQGEHWNRIPAFNFKWGHRVQVDPEDPAKVYVSTFGGGVWHVPIEGSKASDISTPEVAP
ncbi:hypothetical protein BDD14_4520 [Edaphobacter modestus]|uniref:BNR/Asp-box repeat protein n=2 Tax=Edaphobacter modestus TaxID=388466 RepID=A0A4Q7Z0D8_9BACT|nr:hypothetical protein BDD14_4520 [Edaphobacter modestus]